MDDVCNQSALVTRERWNNANYLPMYNKDELLKLFSCKLQAGDPIFFGNLQEALKTVGNAMNNEIRKLATLVKQAKERNDANDVYDKQFCMNIIISIREILSKFLPTEQLKSAYTICRGIKYATLLVQTSLTAATFENLYDCPDFVTLLAMLRAAISKLLQNSHARHQRDTQKLAVYGILQSQDSVWVISMQPKVEANSSISEYYNIAISNKISLTSSDTISLLVTFIAYIAASVSEVAAISMKLDELFTLKILAQQQSKLYLDNANWSNDIVCVDHLACFESFTALQQCFLSYYVASENWHSLCSKKVIDSIDPLKLVSCRRPIPMMIFRLEESIREPIPVYAIAKSANKPLNSLESPCVELVRISREEDNIFADSALVVANILGKIQLVALTINSCMMADLCKNSIVNQSMTTPNYSIDSPKAKRAKLCESQLSNFATASMVIDPMSNERLTITLPISRIALESIIEFDEQNQRWFANGIQFDNVFNSQKPVQVTIKPFIYQHQKTYSQAHSIALIQNEHVCKVYGYYVTLISAFSPDLSEVLQSRSSKLSELYELSVTEANLLPITHLNSLEYIDIRQIFKQMALGVKALHENNIIHQDIKLERFKLRKAVQGEFCVVLVDFEQSLNEIQQLLQHDRTVLATEVNGDEYRCIQSKRYNTFRLGLTMADWYKELVVGPIQRLNYRTDLIAVQKWLTSNYFKPCESKKHSYLSKEHEKLNILASIISYTNETITVLDIVNEFTSN